MKNLVLLISIFTILTISLSGFKQDNVRMRWSAFVVHEDITGDADRHFTGEIPTGWRIYSSDMGESTGPLSTSIEFDPSPSFDIVGPPIESGKSVSFFDNSLGMRVKCLTGKVSYIQHIKCKTKTFAIKCVISYMLSRDDEMLPPDEEDFTISVDQ